jgi:Protein of unknown function (DUF3501)
MTVSNEPEPTQPGRILTLDDVLDLRAYERVRDRYRRQVIEQKRVRRIPLGPIMTIVFESLETVRFQVHEMVRAERILSDDAIQTELDVYNRLLPGPGELSGTLFIELTSEEELRTWLPALVGIEHALQIEIGAGPLVVRSVPESTHADALTREEVTPAVHYLRFPFPEGAADRLESGPAVLAVRHPRYEAETELSDATRSELAQDLRGRTDLRPIA